VRAFILLASTLGVIAASVSAYAGT